MKLTDTLVEKLVEKYDAEIKDGDSEAKDKKESLKDFYRDWNVSKELTSSKTLAVSTIDIEAMKKLFAKRDEQSTDWPDNALEGGVFQNLPPTPTNDNESEK
jgi:hypothetical protein